MYQRKIAVIFDEMSTFTTELNLFQPLAPQTRPDAESNNELCLTAPSEKRNKEAGVGFDHASRAGRGGGPSPRGSRRALNSESMVTRLCRLFAFRWFYLLRQVNSDAALRRHREQMSACLPESSLIRTLCRVMQRYSRCCWIAIRVTRCKLTKNPPNLLR